MDGEKLPGMISVIVPVYNVEDYAGRCIESIINQTYGKLEILLIDDGSTDSSGSICDAFARKDGRIRVIHKTNGGLSDARNYGLNIAKGEFIGFVDGDDWIHPQMYEILYEMLTEYHSDLAACSFEREDLHFGSHVLDKEQIEVKNITREEALINISIPNVVAWNKLYRSCLFADIRYPAGKYHEDEFVIHELLWKCSLVSIVNKRLYFYTRRENSIIGKMSPKRIQDALCALEGRIRFADEHKWNEVLPAVIGQYCDYCINWYFELRKETYQIEQKYMILLWRSEREMLLKYPEVSMDIRYKKFARNPQIYKKHIAREDFIRNIKMCVKRCIMKLK